MEVEYEVESILKAKVFMKGKRMGWKFYVKWKGYEDSDNTWEPFKSFENCGEEIVKRFWDGVDTKGRDVNLIDGWTNGEEVFPTGSPRRKNRTIPREDGPANTESSMDEQSLSRSRGTPNGVKAKRPVEFPEPQNSSKRKRTSSGRRKSGTQRTRRSQRESRTPVPDSEPEEELLVSTLQKTATDDMLVDIDASGPAEQVDAENSITSHAQGHMEKPAVSHHPPTASGAPARDQSQPSTSTTVDETNLSSSSYFGVNPPQQLAVPHIPSARNGSRGLKGRNASLLTFSKKKGGLETLKRKSSLMDSEAIRGAEKVVEVQESNSAAHGDVTLHSDAEIALQDGDGTSAASEQIKLTSHDDAERRALPDYEEQNRACPSSPTIELPEKMPTSISFPEPSSGGSSPWKRATIFGPLATGTGLPSWVSCSNPDAGSLSPITKPFLLSLDNSISMPVVLKDVSSAPAINNLHLESVVSGSSGPPGKLYTSLAANALLETLETGGSCARLVPCDTATGEQRRIFDAFCSKLGEGGLFLVMASSEVLACCSSTNEDYAKKLALASALRGLSETVVVSHVKVANYSAFADAAAQAENVRW